MPKLQHLTTEYGAKIAYRKTPGVSPGVVFLTGFMSNMEGSKATYIENFVASLGHSFLRFDYRGHGESSDLFANGTITDWANDAITAIHELTDGPQILVGSSMGGWIMLKAALSDTLQNKIIGLVGLAPAPDFTRIIHRHYMNDEQRETMKTTGHIEVACDYDDSPYIITKKLLEDGETNCLLDSEIPIDIPVRLVHGMEDQDVAWQTSIALSEALKSTDVETLFIKDGDHRLSSEKNLIKITEVLGTLLGQLTTTSKTEP